jgi:hypothetical protein
MNKKKIYFSKIDFSILFSKVLTTDLSYSASSSFFHWLVHDGFNCGPSTVVKVWLNRGNTDSLERSTVVNDFKYWLSLLFDLINDFINFCWFKTTTMLCITLSYHSDHIFYAFFQLWLIDQSVSVFIALLEESSGKIINLFSGGWHSWLWFWHALPFTSPSNGYPIILFSCITSSSWWTGCWISSALINKWSWNWLLCWPLWFWSLWHALPFTSPSNGYPIILFSSIASSSW